MTGKHEDLVSELYEIAQCEKENGASDWEIAVAMLAMALVAQFDAFTNKVAPDSFSDEAVEAAKKAAATHIFSRYSTTQ